MSPPSDVPGMPALVDDAEDGALLRVHVRPRSHRRGVLGVRESALVIGVGATPEKGRATAEALRALADWLDISPAKLTVVSGATSRSKRVAIAGMSAPEVRARTAALVGSDPS